MSGGEIRDPLTEQGKEFDYLILNDEIIDRKAEIVIKKSQKVRRL